MIKINGTPVTPTIFPDKTSQVWKLPESFLQHNTAALVEWKFENEGEFMQLAQLKDLLGEYGVTCDLKLPYLPYARQDKGTNNNTTFALYPFAHLLNSLDFRDVEILDPHSNQALDWIANARATYPSLELARVIIETEASVLCYPDKGAVEKYTKIRELPYVNFPYMYGEKVRDQLTGNILSYEIKGNPAGMNVLIVDDICDGGMTFKLLAKDLLAAGAKSVVLFVTHGIFSKGVKTLIDSGITRVFTADGEVYA